MKTVTPVNETSFETPQFKSLKETPTKTMVIYKVKKPVSFRNNFNEQRCMLLKITTFLEFPLTSSSRQVLFKFFKGYFYQFCCYRCFHPCQWPRVED